CLCHVRFAWPDPGGIEHGQKFSCVDVADQTEGGVNPRRLRFSHPVMSPIALSDSELATVMRAAAVLNVADRDPFLRAVADALAGREFGDGIVSRTCAELQKRFWRPPELDGRPAGLSKYAR